MNNELNDKIIKISTSWGRKSYERAFFKAKEVNGNIVHGLVYPHVIGKHIKHAWVEAGKIVYDDSTPRPIERLKKSYYIGLDARVNNIYTIEEAHILVMSTRSFGPWTKKEMEHGRKLYEGLKKKGKKKKAIVKKLIQGYASRDISEYVDSNEMTQIMSDNTLLAKLEEGHKDAKGRAGRFARTDKLVDVKIFETEQFLSNLGMDQFFKDIEQNFNKEEKIKNKLKTYVYPQLIGNPHFGKEIKQLKNYAPETWRYKMGNHRFFYTIDDSEKIVFMVATDARFK